MWTACITPVSRQGRPRGGPPVACRHLVHQPAPQVLIHGLALTEVEALHDHHSRTVSDMLKYRPILGEVPMSADLVVVDATIPIVHEGFDYASLPNDVRPVVIAAAAAIRARIRRTTEDMLEIGRQLTAIKSSLPHGAWREWLAAEFEMSERAAQGCMQAAAFADETKSANLADLPPSTVSRLIAAPLPVRASLLSRVEAGEKVTLSDVEIEIRKAKNASPVPARLFQSDLVDALADLQRARAGKLGVDIVALGVTLAQGGALAMAGRKVTQVWAIEVYHRVKELVAEFARLTGRSATHETFGKEGDRIDSVVKILVEVESKYYKVWYSYGDDRKPKLDDLIRWCQGLADAGLIEPVKPFEPTPKAKKPKKTTTDTTT